MVISAGIQRITSSRESIFMYPFRAFISYAHADRERVERLSGILRETGLDPLWDTAIPGGAPFDDVIRRSIAQAHVFMPLITANSLARVWVHQEIGYALGIGVPVLPVAIGAVPPAMLSGVQAIAVEDDLAGLRAGIERADIELLVLRGGELERLGITTLVADFSEERTGLLVRIAREVRGSARVRQRAIFSSFSLPDAPPNHHLWEAIELPGANRSEYYRSLLWQEREVLEHHARSGGCSLLLNPVTASDSLEARVHRAQLNILRQFLLSMPADKISVATGSSFAGNLTIVGDWFGARALPPKPGSGYRETIFSQHGPSVLRWVREFDQELDHALRRAAQSAGASRDSAVQWIDKRLNELPTSG